jgi:hypothetical protein
MWDLGEDLWSCPIYGSIGDNALGYIVAHQGASRIPLWTEREEEWVIAPPGPVLHAILCSLLEKDDLNSLLGGYQKAEHPGDPQLPCSVHQVHFCLFTSPVDQPLSSLPGSEIFSPKKVCGSIVSRTTRQVSGTDIEHGEWTQWQG